MGHFDLHCDTLSRCAAEKASLLSNNFDISVERGPLSDYWVQAFAVFINDDLRGARAYHAFQAQAEVLKKALESGGPIVSYDPDHLEKGVCNAMLTVENGAALGGEDVVAVGSDFDGAAMPSRLEHIERIPEWHENLRKHFGPELAEKIAKVRQAIEA